MFTIGADPELFAKDHNGVIKSLIDKLGGSKYNPRPIGNGYFLQEDNVAAEFNIPPCSSREEFIKAINYSLDRIELEIKDKYGYSISDKASYHFDTSELQHPAAWIFGCEPDFNVWTREQNPPPLNDDINFRTAGGHVHIASDFDPELVVKMCDLTLGVPSVILDKDTDRRKLYGKAGAFRFGKKYNGIEYRVLSNFWVLSNKLVGWVYDQVGRSLDLLKNDPKFAKSIVDLEKERIIGAINNNNIEYVDYLSKAYPDLIVYG